MRYAITGFLLLVLSLGCSKPESAAVEPPKMSYSDACELVKNRKAQLDDCFMMRDAMKFLTPTPAEIKEADEMIAEFSKRYRDAVELRRSLEPKKP